MSAHVNTQMIKDGEMFAVAYVDTTGFEKQIYTASKAAQIRQVVTY